MTMSIVTSTIWINKIKFLHLYRHPDIKLIFITTVISPCFFFFSLFASTYFTKEWFSNNVVVFFSFKDSKQRSSISDLPEILTRKQWQMVSSKSLEWPTLSLFSVLTAKYFVIHLLYVVSNGFTCGKCRLVGILMEKIVTLEVRV